MNSYNFTLIFLELLVAITLGFVAILRNNSDEHALWNAVLRFLANLDRSPTEKEVLRREEGTDRMVGMLVDKSV